MNRFIAVGALALPLAVLAAQAQAPASIDREYTLESTMLGYKGIGGDIDGVRNPPLWARSGETIRINIVNGELMVHDVTLEKHNVRRLLLLAPGTPCRGHGGAAGGRRTAARSGSRCGSHRGRAAAQP
jgi:hypothetical protein